MLSDTKLSKSTEKPRAQRSTLLKVHLSWPLIVKALILIPIAAGIFKLFPSPYKINSNVSSIASKDTSDIVFKVSEDVELASLSDYETYMVSERLSESRIFSNIKIESSYNETKIIKPKKFPRKLTLNGFAEAVHLAYDQHHGLALSPEQLFIVILQGLSVHISQDPEKHRATLGLGHTAPGTKEEIDIRRDAFKLGDPSNDWQGVFPDFSKSIGEMVSKEIHSLLDAPFSTSTPLSQAVTSLSIMDIFKSYFDYSVTTMCGIPSIALMGTTEDWVDLRARTESLLSKFDDLEFWTENLYPVLDQFVSVATQNEPVDKKFWRSIYKPEGGSGGPHIKGWIGVFYPYIQGKNCAKKNPFLEWDDNDPFMGLTYDDFPSGFTTTPFTWNYHHLKFKMEFLGGFLGVEKANSSKLEGFVTPSLAWAVTHVAE